MRKTVNLRRPETSRDLADRWLGCDEDDLAAYSEVQRPRTRADCEDGPRPCPWVGCRYSLYLDVKNRSIKLNFPALEVDEMVESCALDVADRGEATLPELSAVMNLSYDRSYQITALGLAHAKAIAAELAVEVEGPPARKPRVANASRRTTDPDLHGISTAIHAATPVFRKADYRDVPRAEVARLFPGVAISANYGEPRPQPQVEAAPRDPRAALRASMRRCLG